MPRTGAGAETPRSKPQSPLRIAHDGEFYARLLTKESSLGNPSFRYYGTGPGAVPFVWESHPGTPKDADCYSSSAAAAVVPAITPPPSYHQRRATGSAAGPRHGHGSRRLDGNAANKYCGCKLNRWIKISFIATVFRRLAFANKPTTKRPPAASVKSSSSSSTRWLFSGSGVAEARDNMRAYCGYDDVPPPPTRKRQTTMLCLGVRPSPWMVQFWGSGRREPAGLVYG